MGKINRKEKIILYSGFYAPHYMDTEQALYNIACETVLDIEEWGNLNHPYQQLSIFLHGSCQLFALALNKKYGYPVYEILQNGEMVHTFCIMSYHRQKMYIDVRGATSDFEEFMRGVWMIDWNEYSLHLRNIQEDEKLKNEWDNIGYAFAQAIIARFPEYYGLS